MSAGYDFFLMDEGGEDFGGASNVSLKPTVIASEFSENTSYSAGDFVTRYGLLYVCQSASVPAGEWDGSDWQQITVTDAINSITIEVDDTLTQSGKAADAKAAGDGIALKLNASETITTVQIDGLFS